jgi:hypothetical protein
MDVASERADYKISPPLLGNAGGKVVGFLAA